MRGFKYPLIILAVVVFAATIFIKPIITHVVKQGLRGVFLGSSVSIGDFSLDIKRKALVSDLRIYKKNSYDFKLKQLKVEYSPAKIIHGKLLKVSLEGLAINIQAPKQTLKEFTQNFSRQSGGFFSVESVELSGADIKIKLSDFSSDAKLSLAANLRERSINNLDLNINHLDAANWHLENLTVANISKEGLYRLSLGQIEYGDAKLDRLSAEAKLKGDRLIISQLSGEMFKGRVTASAEFVLANPVIYSINIETVDLDIADLLDSFKARDKFEMTGKLGGKISIQGSGQKMSVAMGNLSLPTPGGELAIKDSDLLNNIAAGSRQSSGIIKESFKDYHYNTGTMSVSLNNNDLSLVVALEGQSGKRNFNLVWHDFIK